MVTASPRGVMVPPEPPAPLRVGRISTVPPCLNDPFFSGKAFIYDLPTINSVAWQSVPLHTIDMNSNMTVQ